MGSQTQHDIFDEQILEPVINCYLRTSQSLCGFMALKGSKYNGLMVVGRAVNSWGNGKSTAALQDSDTRNEFINGLLFPEAECQMAWVAKDAGNTEAYNTKKSAFWRVIRRVSRELGVWVEGEEDSWSSRLVWSNLYKISPHAGGNPSDRLCAIQERGCIDLLGEEIREYAPERILFLTGMNWAWPFLKGLGSEPPQSNDLAEASGTLPASGRNKPIPFVVAKHPQGKDESKWVEEVVGRFESLA